MEDTIKEKNIKTSPEPVSYKATETILSQMNNCVCRIYINNCEGKDFLLKYHINRNYYQYYLQIIM